MKLSVTLSTLSLLAGAHAQAGFELPKIAFQKVLADSIEGVVFKGNGLSSGIPDDDKMYLTSSEGTVLTIRQSDGEVLNEYQEIVVGGGGGEDLRCYTTVQWDSASNNELGVFACSSSVFSTVTIINSDGNLHKKFQVEGRVQLQPMMRFGEVWVAHNDQSGNGHITRYNVETATQTVEQSFPGALVSSVTRTSNDGVYFGTNTGEVHYIDYLDPNGSGMIDSGFTGILGSPYANPGGTNLVVPTQAAELLMWSTNGGGIPPGTSPNVIRPLPGGISGCKYIPYICWTCLRVSECTF